MPSDPASASEKPRPVMRDLLLLTILCALINTLGLTDFGVSNWQESVRLITSRDMQARGDWIVPTIEGVPYLAKPPLVYWCTIALAEATRSEVELWHLRLVVAIFGWLSVLMTYLAGRSILGTNHQWSPARASRTAWWGALFLATGTLHVRMSRTGAIDIAMVPFVIGAIWASFLAWQRPGPRARIVSLMLAVLITSGLAALVKGPPAMLAILTAIVGGIMGWHAYRAERKPNLAFLLALLAFLAVVLAEAHRLRDIRDGFGMLLTALGVAWFIFTMAALIGREFRPAIRSLFRAHIPASIVGALLFAWLWSSAVSRRIGEEAVRTAIEREMGANVDILRPSAGIQLIEAASYGAGLGSIFAFAGAWALISRKERLTPGLAVIAAWVGVTLVAFAAFSTGAGRYITPMWPGLALLGAVGFTHLRERAAGPWLMRLTTLGVIVLAVAQTWWYADGRQRFEHNQSPRDFVRELKESGDLHPDRVASLGFWNGGLPYYAGLPVIAVDRPGFPTHAPQGMISLDDFARRVRASNEPWTLLITHPGWTEDEIITPPEEVAHLGLSLEHIPVTARYGEKDGRHAVFAYRVTPE